MFFQEFEDGVGVFFVYFQFFEDWEFGFEFIVRVYVFQSIQNFYFIFIFLNGFKIKLNKMF